MIFDSQIATGLRPMLTDKVVIVTGVANGIGRAALALFAQAGASVVGCDIDDVGAKAAAADASGDTLTLQADVTSASDMKSVVQATLDWRGKIDGLYNNAGVGTIADVPVPLHETVDDIWDRTLDVNLRGTFVTTRAVLPHLLDRGGAIVNVASVYALVAGPEAPAYIASKGGVVSLNRSIAVDYAPYGIRSNVICPGFTETAMVLDYVEKLEDPQAARTEIDGAHLLNRLGLPGEIAATALWLLSDAASFVTGATIPVDGGYTVR